MADLRSEYEADPEGEFVGELADDALSRLWDEGYANIEADDTLLIMPKGVELPADWQ